MMDLAFLQDALTNIAITLFALGVIYFIVRIAGETLTELDTVDIEHEVAEEEEELAEGNLIVLQEVEELTEQRMSMIEYLASNVWIRFGIPLAAINTVFILFFWVLNANYNVYTTSDVFVALGWLGMFGVFAPWAIVLLEITKDILHKVVIDRKAEVEYLR